MADVQVENGYIRIANEIWDEIIRRDFSKRQKDILLFIWRLSYGCSKKTAIVPKLKHFSLCGVGSTNITQELKYLQDMKVISWDREQMIFSFNKNYELWQVSPVRGWDDEIFDELIHLNISKKTSQINNLSKQEVINSISEKLLKQEVLEPEIPCGSKAEGMSKDSIKDINKEEEDEPQTAMDAYFFSFKKINYTGHIQNYVLQLFNRGFTDAFVREVFMEMGAKGVGPDIDYMKKMAEDWISKGVYTRTEAKRRWEAEKLRIVTDTTKKRDPELLARDREIARNKWIQEGNDPNEFVYRPASGH